MKSETRQALLSAHVLNSPIWKSNIFLYPIREYIWWTRGANVDCRLVLFIRYIIISHKNSSFWLFWLTYTHVYRYQKHLHGIKITYATAYNPIYYCIFCWTIIMLHSVTRLEAKPFLSLIWEHFMEVLLSYKKMYTSYFKLTKYNPLFPNQNKTRGPFTTHINVD